MILANRPFRRLIPNHNPQLVVQIGLSNGIHDDGKRSHGVERANSDVQDIP